MQISPVIVLRVTMEIFLELEPERRQQLIPPRLKIAVYAITPIILLMLPLIIPAGLTTAQNVMVIIVRVQ